MISLPMTSYLPSYNLYYVLVLCIECVVIENIIGVQFSRILVPEPKMWLKMIIMSVGVFV